MWLLADVGGTHCRVGLAEGGGLCEDRTRSYRNDDFGGLDGILSRYLAETGATVDGLCAGVAGPVRQGRARLTNRGWRIEADGLRAVAGAQAVHLINDLQAQGYGLDDLAPGTVTSLFAGAGAAAGATRLVMGLGTGCNVAAVHDQAGQLFVPPAEAGHSGLPHVPGLPGGIMQALGAGSAHLPVEALLSGPGLERLHGLLSGAEGAAIWEAMSRRAPEATATLEVFAAFLGHVAGNFALMHLPMGGVYFIGGVARAVAPHLGSAFRSAFEARGPYAGMMADIPVFLVTDDDAALRGCARLMRQMRR